MVEPQKKRVLVVGAGSMGLISAYHLSLGGADVTYLVRSHRLESLKRPQLLYCYNDNQLKEYSEYRLVTDPAEIVGADYDFIVVTVDGAALQNETGQDLVKTIGQAARDTDTKIILGTVFSEIRSWFIQTSGLQDSQVVEGFLQIHAYSPNAVTLPVHEPANPELIAKADLAFIDKLGTGITIDDSPASVSAAFAELWNASRVSQCGVQPMRTIAPSVYAMFAVFAACELLDWPRFQDIDTDGEVWRLAVAAAKEIQGLGIYGEAGQQAAATEGMIGASSLAMMENIMLPLDLQAFNRFHHGGKVNLQDRQIRRTCLAYGEEEGRPMSALRELVRRTEERLER